MELIKQNSQTQIIKSLLVIFIGSIILAILSMENVVNQYWLIIPSLIFLFWTVTLLSNVNVELLKRLFSFQQF